MLTILVVINHYGNTNNNKYAKKILFHLDLVTWDKISEQQRVSKSVNRPEHINKCF